MSVHRSGFVNIIGNPNVGKSTLMNCLVGEKMSIITSKPQTTRHRIFGILNGEDHQAVFSDTPGVIENPHYGMQDSMNRFAFSSFEDADILLLVTDIFEEYTGEEKILKPLNESEAVKFLIINKIDLDTGNNAEAIVEKWQSMARFDKCFMISAQSGQNMDELLKAILDALPESPPYYPKDELSDRPERFFAAEIIRERILVQYKQEVPYSCEVVVHRFKEENRKDGPILMIYADIYVDRKSQKPIIIGKGGEAIKKLGIDSRGGLEEFFGQHVFLDLNVKIKENWRNDQKMLKHFGYEAGRQ